MLEIKTADSKTEKHVPVIKVSEIQYNKPVEIQVSVGEEIPHPNTPEHHIAWIELYYVPKDGTTPFFIGRAEFAAHGEVNLWTEPKTTFVARIQGPGKLIALSFCNIHGLWMSEKEI